MHPDDPDYLLLEARALAALGRPDEVWALVDQRAVFSEQREFLAGSMSFTVAQELRLHGNPEAGREMYARSIAWHRENLTDDPDSRGRLAYVLFAAHHSEEARVLFRDLVAADPNNIGFHGALGVLAARLGDEAEAERIAAWLADQRQPYQRGQPSYWRACILAHLGRQPESLNALRSAFREGTWYTNAHSFPGLDPLRDHPSFRDLMRPEE